VSGFSQFLMNGHERYKPTDHKFDPFPVGQSRKNARKENVLLDQTRTKVGAALKRSF
jgi:hypothetical protein